MVRNILNQLNFQKLSQRQAVLISPRDASLRVDRFEVANKEQLSCERRKLTALVHRRLQILSQQSAERNRMKQSRDEQIQELIQEAMTFCLSLLARGKGKKVALVAWMRKLLTIMNCMIRNNEIWRTSPEATA